MSVRRALQAGAESATPILLGMVPWGLVTGVAMVSAGLTNGQAVGMSLLAFAGSAQLAVLPLFIVKAPLWIMCVTALMVNLRFVVYSAVLAPHFSHLSFSWRALLSYLTVDGMFARFVARYPSGSDDPHKHWFYLGGGALLWVGWQIASLVGVFGGALIPRDWSLEFMATLAIIALVIPLMYDRAVVCGAVVSGIVALVARALPMNAGIVVAVASGVIVGLLVSSFAPSGRKEGTSA